MNYLALLVVSLAALYSVDVKAQQTQVVVDPVLVYKIRDIPTLVADLSADRGAATIMYRRVQEVRPDVTSVQAALLLIGTHGRLNPCELGMEVETAGRINNDETSAYKWRNCITFENVPEGLVWLPSADGTQMHLVGSSLCGNPKRNVRKTINTIAAAKPVAKVPPKASVKQDLRNRCVSTGVISTPVYDGPASPLFSYVVGGSERSGQSTTQSICN